MDIEWKVYFIRILDIIYEIIRFLSKQELIFESIFRVYEDS